MNATMVIGLACNEETILTHYSKPFEFLAFRLERLIRRMSTS